MKDFTEVRNLLDMKIEDNPVLKECIERFKNIECGCEFESFDLFEKTEVQKLRSSKERKVWKLKRLNVKLGQQRRATYNQMITLSNESELFTSILIAYTLRVGYISEQIGKNSNKIQRLRTLIQQEKVSGNKSNS